MPSDVATVEESLIFGSIVGRQEVDLENIFESLTGRGDEHDASPAPSILREPSKYIIQYSSFSVMACVWTSVHSAMKSMSTWDLMAVRGWKVSSKEPSSTAHFAIRSVASQL